MRLFTRTIELGSFSAVARAEQVTQPTVSKVIAALEKSLGVRLVERTTTSLTPTEEGRRFYQRCKQLVEEYVDAVADVRGAGTAACWRAVRQRTARAWRIAPQYAGPRVSGGPSAN